MKHEPAVLGHFTCTKCHETKHALAFPHNPKKANGISSWCRACSVHNSNQAKTRSMPRRVKFSFGGSW